MGILKKLYNIQDRDDIRRVVEATYRRARRIAETDPAYATDRLTPHEHGLIAAFSSYQQRTLVEACLELGIFFSISMEELGIAALTDYIAFLALGTDPEVERLSQVLSRAAHELNVTTRPDILNFVVAGFVAMMPWRAFLSKSAAARLDLLSTGWTAQQIAKTSQITLDHSISSGGLHRLVLSSLAVLFCLAAFVTIAVINVRQSTWIATETPVDSTFGSVTISVDGRDYTARIGLDDLTKKQIQAIQRDPIRRALGGDAPKVRLRVYYNPSNPGDFCSDADKATNRKAMWGAAAGAILFGAGFLYARRHRG